MRVAPYTNVERKWLDREGQNSLQNSPPGCLFAIGVYGETPDLFGEPTWDGVMKGLCLIGRPEARKLPQDGTWGEITRMVLLPGLPYGTASNVIRFASKKAAIRGMRVLIAYHDRTRHSGCIYKKAGFKKWGVVKAAKGKGW